MRGLGFLIGLLSLSLGCIGCQQRPTAITTSPTVAPPSPSAIPSPAPLLAQTPAPPNPILNRQLDAFIVGTTASGSLRQNQGVWMQTDTQLLANVQGTVPLSAASLTKVATSLAALQTLGPNYRFVTKVGVVGTINQGILQGDLVVEGGQDPLFVWEDAITLGNLLQQQGIRKIQGKVIVVGPFYMNFETSPIPSGTFLKQGLDASQWPAEALGQYQTLPSNTPQPQVAISGGVVTAPAAPASVQWILQHQSLPLATLLKKMNRYSNNPMADMIAATVGGAQVVAQKAIASTGVPASEIQLVNGSGLSPENRMSPRAVCALFLAIERLVKPQGLTIADIFTVIGQEESVLDSRPLPKQAVLKSGTLDTVSTLAGALPTQKAGALWFVLMNNEGNVESFRNLQERFLSTVQQTFGRSTAPIPVLEPSSSADAPLDYTQQWSPL